MEKFKMRHEGKGYVVSTVSVTIGDNESYETAVIHQGEHLEVIAIAPNIAAARRNHDNVVRECKLRYENINFEEELRKIV